MIEKNWRAEGNEHRTPTQRSLHDALHDVEISHDCLGAWIDDHDWERLADALVARGWTPPATSGGDGAGRLSKLLWEAREKIDMFGDVVEARAGTSPDSRRVRDEIDAYRAERGWSPNGFGGES